MILGPVIFKVPINHLSGKFSRLSNREMSRGEVQAGEMNSVWLYIGLKLFKAITLELTKGMNLDKIVTKAKA